MTSWDLLVPWSHSTVPKSIYVLPEMKLRYLVPNFYIHVSVSDLYIPRIAHRYMNVEIGRQNIIVLFWK